MQKNKKIAIIVAAAILVLLAVGLTLFFALQEKQPPSSQTSVHISLDRTDIMLLEDESIVLQATTDAAGTVQWETDAANIVSVSATGRVIAKSAGVAHVTASLGEASASCTVTVAPAGEEKARIEVQKTSVRLAVSQGADIESISAVCYDAEGVPVSDANFSYVSSDPQVVTVSGEGALSPVSAGTAEITVSANGLKESVQVEVYTMLVRTADDWDTMLQYHGDRTVRFYVENDIDFEGFAYKTYAEPNTELGDYGLFMGEVDGGGHILKNITMPSDMGQQSLFGAATALTLKNISFANVRFTNGQANGLFNRLMHHISENGEMVVYQSTLSNISLDFIYENHGVCGIMRENYGCVLENIFVNMRMADGSDFDPAQDYGIAQSFIIWTSPNYFSNVIFCTNGGKLSYDWSLNYGSLDVAKDSVFSYEGLMEAGYRAYQLFDGNIWIIRPNELPVLK